MRRFFEDRLSLELGTGLVGLDFADGFQAVDFRADFAGTDGLALAKPVQPARMEADDHGNDAASATVLEQGVFQSAMLETADDEDWFSLQVTAGTEVVVTTSLELGGLTDATYRIVDQDGVDVPFTATENDNMETLSTVAIDYDGLLFIVAVANGAGDLPYMLSARTAQDDFGDTPETAGAPDANGLIAGEIEAQGDSDWFEIEVSGSDNTLLALFNNPDFELQQVTLSLYDASGQQLFATELDTFVQDPTPFADLGNGTYYLGVSAGFGAGSYTVQTSFATDDYGSSLAQAESFAFDTQYSGTIDYAGDRDVFTFTLLESSQISFDLVENGVQDVFLEVQNVDTRETSSGSSSFVASLAAGTYTISAQGFDGTGEYSFSASGGEAAADDTPGNASTTRVAEVNGASVSGVIEFGGDDDWFQISTVQGQTYEFSLPDNALDDLTIQVVDGNGNVVDEAFVEASFDLTEVFVGFVASQTGDYFLSISEGNSGFFEPISYDFTIASEAVAEDDFASDTSTTGVVTINADGTTGSLGGVLEESGDSDWFAFDAVAGQTLQFIGTTEIVFEIYDANGVRVTEGVRLTGGQMDPGSAVFDVADSGQYFVAVSQSSGVAPINYGASYAVVPSDETGPIDPGDTVTVFLSDAQDVDDYTITLEAGTEYYFSGGGNASMVDLLDSIENFTAGFDTQRVFTVSESADYILRFMLDAFSVPSELFNFRLIEVPDDEVTVSTTQAALEAGVLSFSHGQDDLDGYSFDLSGSSSRAFRVIFEDEDAGVALDNSVTGAGGPSTVSGTLGGVLTVYFEDSLGDTGELVLTGASDGEYKFRIEEIEDDFVNSSATTSTLSIGDDGTVSGDIQFAGDSDWHAITVSEAVALRLSAAGTQGVFFATPVDAQGNDLNVDPFASGTDPQTVVLDAGETIYVAVSGDNPDFGAYNLRADVIPDDHANGADGATVINVGDSVVARTDYHTDTDAFTITADARDVIVVEFEGNFFDDYALLGPDGEVIELGFGGFGEFAFQAEVAGDYTLVINAGSGEMSEGTETRFEVSSRVDELTGGTDTVGRIETNRTASSSYEFFGDVDAFGFTIESGEAITFQTVNGGVRRYQVLDADGNVVRSGLPDENLTVDGLSAGEYFLVLNSTEGSTSYGGDYRIAAISSIDDYGNLPSDANIGSVAVGGSVTGAFNPGAATDGTIADQDAFTITLAEGQSIVVGTRSINGGSRVGTLLLGPDGAPLAANLDLDDNYTGPLTFTAEVAGDYTLIAFGTSENVTDIYSLDIYTQSVGGDGSDQIVGTGARDVIQGGAGDDMLFGDGPRGVPSDSFEAQLYRSYQAVFDRAPDAAGFEFFLDTLQLGIFTQESVLNEFVGSQEFQDTYGDLSNREFVEQLYRNVLDREGDANGINAFTAALDTGATRAQVVLDFANSGEFIQSSAVGTAAFLNNVSLSPYEGQVYRAYQGVFGREPDIGGFDIFIGALEIGLLDLQGIINDFTGSPEFQDTYGELSNADFVELLYTNVLPGNTDPVGRAAFTAALDNGDLTRAQVVLDFTESFDFQQATAADAIAFRDGIFVNNTDLIFGGTGNDTMFGGRGVDVFVYFNGMDGEDTILDFTPGVDVIDIGQTSQALPFIFGYGELQQYMSQDGNDVVIDFLGGNTLRLANVQMDALSERDFVLTNGIAEDTIFTSAELPPESTDISKPEIPPVSEVADTARVDIDTVEATVTFDGLFWMMDDHALF